MPQPDLSKALKARQAAYAPYSGFQVGAALECSDGSWFYGCNIENGSYSMTICAERCAIFAAIAAGHRSFRQIIIAGGKTDQEAEMAPCVPCGACLQVLSEFCPPTLPVVLADGDHTLGDFLPAAFQLRG